MKYLYNVTHCLNVLLQPVFEGICGDGYTGGIVIDDVEVSSGTCGKLEIKQLKTYKPWHVISNNVAFWQV